MNFDEIVDNRRSARLFTNDEVSEKQLEKILSSGSLAPSKRLKRFTIKLTNTKQMARVICFALRNFISYRIHTLLSKFHQVSPCDSEDSSYNKNQHRISSIALYIYHMF